MVLSYSTRPCSKRFVVMADGFKIVCSARHVVYAWRAARYFRNLFLEFKIRHWCHRFLWIPRDSPEDALLARILGEPSNPGAGHSTALCEMMGVPSRSADMAGSPEVDTGSDFRDLRVQLITWGRPNHYRPFPLHLLISCISWGQDPYRRRKVVALALWTADIVRTVLQEIRRPWELMVHIGTPHLRKDSSSSLWGGER